MKQKLTNKQAFDLAQMLQEERIREIKDTEFGLAVYKNYNTILEEFNKLEKLNVMPDGFEELVKGVKTEEEYNKLKEDSKNKELFDKREKVINKYNKELEKEFKPSLIKVKLKNLNTKLSANDIGLLESMLIL
jgi:hypothetical protein